MLVFISYLLIGAFAGLLSGLLGIGGGIVVVPLLASMYEKMGFPKDMIMHFAAGTSLAVMIITTSASVRAHTSLGNKIWPIFKILLPGLILGTIAGATIADYLHSHVLKMIFGSILLVIAFRAFFAKTTEAPERIPSKKVMTVVSFFLGSISGMLGIGGGAIMVPFLMQCNVNLRISVAIAAGCSLLVALVGTGSYMVTGANEIHQLHWVTGYIYWPAFLGVALTSPIFATIGANLSNKLPVDKLRKLFAFFILLAAVKLIVY